MTDVVDDESVNSVIALIPSKKAIIFNKYLKGNLEVIEKMKGIDYSYYYEQVDE
ncbi:MAG: hypothetical protein ACI4MS_00860 [Candidatus Coproplasma sp.]